MKTGTTDNITPIILTGGLGTRLRQVVVDRPKTMALVAGRPFLEYILEQLEAAGFDKAILCVGYLSDQVQAHFGNSFKSMQISYSVEQSLLGTAGAVKFAIGQANTDNILVLNGDSFCGQPLSTFVGNFDTSTGRTQMLVTEVPDTSRYGRVNFSTDGLVSGFEEKGAVSGPGTINAGIYLLHKKRFLQIPPGKNVSLEKQIFPEMCANKELVAFSAGAAPFIDIGTPESYVAASTLFSTWGTKLRPTLTGQEQI